MERARERLAAACREVAAAGLVPATSGNLSVRAGDALLVTPSGTALGSVRPEDLCLLARDGTALDAPGAPTSELPLHLAIYARRPEVAAVVHTHAARAVALTCLADELPPLHYQWLSFGGAVRVAPYRTFGTPELADAVLAALDERTAVLLAHHGTVTVGPDLDTAVARTRLLDWACEVYLAAAAAGTPRELSPGQLAAAAAAARERRYPGLDS